MCNNGSSSISPSNPTSSRLNSQSDPSDDTSVGSWSGRSVRTMVGTSYTSSSDDDQSYITASDDSQSNLTAPAAPATLNNNYTDNGTDLDAVNLDIKGKSIFSKIRDVISKRITLKKLIFLYVPIATVLVISIATGVGFPLVIGVGLASIYFIGAALAKYLSSYNPEDSENPGVNREREQELVEKFNKIQDKLVEDGVQKKAKYLEVYKEKDKDEVDKDKKEIQDPSTLSTWQKVKQKLKIATPFIFGAAIIALGITATVVTGGVFGIIGVAIASMLGVLCIGKGITEVLDYRDEKQEFLDSQNKKQVDDTIKAIDSTTGESDIPEDPRGSIQDQILAPPKDLDPEDWGLNHLPEFKDIETENNQDDLPPDLFSATNSSLPSFNLSPTNSHLGSTSPFNSDDFPKKTDWRPSTRSTPDIDDNGFLRTTSQDDSISDTRKTKATQAANQQQDDPHNLQRFKDAHNGKGNAGSTHKQALEEIKQGKKDSHWMWYIFPQSAGLGKSETSKLYGIKNQEEALAYITDPILGIRLFNITKQVLKHKDKTIQDIFGYPDCIKFTSCMQLFDKTLKDYLDNGNSLPTHFENDEDIFLHGLNKT